MNLRHIESFIAVAEELHFGRAAKRLHIEQSPLSRRIGRLEADLGVTLLHRNGRGVRLTGAGRVFQEDARRVMLACEQAQARSRAAAAGYCGTLRIGLAGDIGRTARAAPAGGAGGQRPAVRSAADAALVRAGRRSVRYRSGVGRARGGRDRGGAAVARSVLGGLAGAASAAGVQGSAAAGGGKVFAGPVRPAGAISGPTYLALFF